MVCRWREEANVLKLAQMRAKMALVEMKKFNKQAAYTTWIEFVVAAHTEPLHGSYDQVSRGRAESAQPGVTEVKQAREIKMLKEQLEDMKRLMQTLQNSQNNNSSNLEQENRLLRKQLAMFEASQADQNLHASPQATLIRHDPPTSEMRQASPSRPPIMCRHRGTPQEEAILRRLGMSGRSVTPPSRSVRGASISPQHGGVRSKSAERPRQYDAEMDHQLEDTELVDNFTVQHMGMSARRQRVMVRTTEKWAEKSGTTLRRASIE